MTQFPELIQRLSEAGVEFIIVGGFAGTVHGSVRSTQDLAIGELELLRDKQRKRQP